MVALYASDCLDLNKSFKLFTGNTLRITSFEKNYIGYNTLFSSSIMTKTIIIYAFGVTNFNTVRFKICVIDIWKGRNDQKKIFWLPILWAESIFADLKYYHGLRPEFRQKREKAHFAVE